MAEGEERRLQIEDVGDKGDGIARVGPGYVVFVSDTEISQQPLVRITTVRENFAFAEVLKQQRACPPSSVIAASERVGGEYLEGAGRVRVAPRARFSLENVTALRR
ncbi:TRAM domain-containing protein [Haloplanus natans]|uniref:TRAM domain-containing protein n=1 Tax=Haloplanus natans TaxID=376171 RepID=UPI00146F9988